MDTGLAAEAERARGSRASVDGIDECFEEAYLRYRDPILHYVRRFATQDDEAVDLTARTFERALTKLSSYRGGRQGFAAWLFRIARNQGIDAIRRRRPVDALELIEPEQHPRSEQGQPEPELMQREANRELADHVRRLPQLQQECLWLRYGAGLSAREIGAVIGKTEAATQKLIGRALCRLREDYS